MQHDDTTGRWEAELGDGDCGKSDGLCVQLMLKRGSRHHESNWGLPIPVAAFTGLAAVTSDYSADRIHFELRRDAGTVRFDGNFDRGDGRGQVTFVPDPVFSSAFRKAGYGSPRTWRGG